MDFELTGVAGADQLEPLWRRVEARSRPSFFLSWPWIRCWLNETGSQPCLLQGRLDGDIKLLGLFHLARRSRFGLPVRALALHQTGRPIEDAIFIEYNGFLCTEDAPETADAQALAFIAGRHCRLGKGSALRWNELLLSGVDESWAGLADELGLEVQIMSQLPCYGMDLDAEVKGSDDLLQTFSANTRQQIRRSLKIYRESGPISLSVARSPDQIGQYLAELKDLHQATWQRRGLPGAFANPHFESFLTRLARDGSAAVDLLKIAAGDRPIGVLCNFRNRSIVHNYQSGLVYADDNRLKPGLVSHFLAMQHYRAAGLSHYDLMAGDSRYKQSLGRQTGTLVWLRVKTLTRIEALASALLGWTRRSMGGRSTGPAERI